MYADLNPKWNERFDLNIHTNIPKKLEFKVWDWNRWASNKLLGTATFLFDDFPQEELKEVFLTLVDEHGDTILGSQIHLEISLYPISKGKNVE